MPDEYKVNSLWIVKHQNKKLFKFLEAKFEKSKPLKLKPVIKDKQENILECPKCKLINPSSTEICDCGYSFKLNPVDKKQMEDLDFFLKGLCFFIPVVGIVLYFSYKKVYYKKASSALRFGLMGIGMWIVIYIF